MWNERTTPKLPSDLPPYNTPCAYKEILNIFKLPMWPSINVASSEAGCSRMGRWSTCWELGKKAPSYPSQTDYLKMAPRLEFLETLLLPFWLWWLGTWEPLSHTQSQTPRANTALAMGISWENTWTELHIWLNSAMENFLLLRRSVQKSTISPHHLLSSVTSWYTLPLATITLETRSHRQCPLFLSTSTVAWKWEDVIFYRGTEMSP